MRELFSASTKRLRTKQPRERRGEGRGLRGSCLILSCLCLVLHVVIFFRLGVGIDVYPSLFLLAFGVGLLIWLFFFQLSLS